MKAALLLSVLAAAALLSLPAAQARTLSVRLVMNGTDGTAYVPGQGEVPASELPDMEYTGLPHWFLASYSGGAVAGLASGSAASLSTAATAASHTLGMDSPLSGSVLVVFTEGDWRTLDSAMPLMEAGAFFTRSLPSFAYGMGGITHPLMLLLEYGNIDLLGGAVLGKGQHRLLISNEGVSGGRPLVRIQPA
jgi:hypothetical protein